MKWDFSVGSRPDGRGGYAPTFFGKHLFKFRGFQIRVHKFVSADEPGCFHTHPAYAFRLVLWGGYVEEVRSAHPPGYGYVSKRETWFPGRSGRVEPKFCHRIDRLLNGRSSWSLWIRLPAVAEVKFGCGDEAP